MKKIEITSLLKSFMLVGMRFSVKLTSGEIIDTVTIKHRYEKDEFLAEKIPEVDGEILSTTFPLVIDEINEVFNVRPPLAKNQFDQNLMLIPVSIDDETVGVIALSERFAQNKINGYNNF